MATTAKRVTAALTRAGLRGRVGAIDDNPMGRGEVVLWRDGMGVPVWSVREALAEVRKDGQRHADLARYLEGPEEP